MNNQQIAKIIKSLAAMPTYQREEIQDEVGTLGFHSGFVSYDNDPVATAIDELSGRIDSQRAWAQGLRTGEAQKNIADIENLISLLK